MLQLLCDCQRTWTATRSGLSHLQTWPLWLWTDVGNDGASVMPSDDAGSLVPEGAGLIGWASMLSVATSTFAIRRMLRKLGDLPCCFPPSGGGERDM